jgi:hypothetical protein
VLDEKKLLADIAEAAGWIRSALSYQSGPSRGDIKKRLSALRKEAISLCQKIGTLDRVTEALLAHPHCGLEKKAKALCKNTKTNHKDGGTEVLQYLLQALISDCKEWEKRLSKPGRPRGWTMLYPDLSVYPFDGRTAREEGTDFAFISFAKVFSKHFGRVPTANFTAGKPQVTMFVEFFRACAEPLDMRYRSQKTLVDAARKALRNKKKLPRPVGWLDTGDRRQN